MLKTKSGQTIDKNFNRETINDYNDKRSKLFERRKNEFIAFR